MSREYSFILSTTGLEVSPMYTVVQSWHESFYTSWLVLYLGIESLTWVSDFPRVFIEVNATRLPYGLSVLLIASEIFGT